MTNPPLIAIGLDAASPELLEGWIAGGELPNLRDLRRSGVYGRLQSVDHFIAETPWTNFLTGVRPEKTGYWGTVDYDPANYSVRECATYDYKEFPPFYALPPEFKVCAFDVPHSIVHPAVHGTQIVGWGAHSPLTATASQPESLASELIAKHGAHPALNKDFGVWWDKKHLRFLWDSVNQGIERRAAICQDLLARERWDLFLTVFGETHAAGHEFWFMSQRDHPMFTEKNGLTPGDPLLAVYQKIDSAIGRVLSAAPADANVVIFAAHGMKENSNDLPSCLFLGEILYRHAFPGKRFYPSRPLDARRRFKTPVWQGWDGEMWREKVRDGAWQRALTRALPMGALERLDRVFGTGPHNSFAIPRRWFGSLSWEPVTWYAPFWPQMKAFALPSFSEGYVRINLKGRDARGVVAESDCEKVCEEVSQVLARWKCARSGRPLVDKVFRTRAKPGDRDPKKTEADLVVIWGERATDFIESPDLGSIGPIPYNRTGSHSERGFFLARTPHVRAGSSLDGLRSSLDLTPTLLKLIGAPIPDYLEGRALL